MRLLKRRFNDEALVQVAERALGELPAVDLSKLTISSEGGIITLGGQTASSVGQRHAVETLEQAFRHANLKYERIVDKIVVGRN